MEKQPFYRNKALMLLGVLAVFDVILISSMTLRSLYLTFAYGTAISFNETICVLVELIALTILISLMEKARKYGNKLYRTKMYPKKTKGYQKFYNTDSQ